ncbi:MAG TPA: hypothetical protein VK881_12140 [bacterium]|nr:hypothetical protein [bacterium]
MKTFDERPPAIVRAFGLVRTLMVIAVGLSLGCGAAAAGPGHPAYLPMIFHAESQSIRTTACLQVVERTYPQSAWWEDTKSTLDAPERALGAVIAAIKRKDRTALYQQSHPTLGRDPKRFDDQAKAFFQQFEVIELSAVPRAYEFDGLAVFFAKIRFKQQTFFAPFIFASEDDGSFGFLPYRTDTVTSQLVADWFNSPWGPAATANPAYCTGEDIKRATHRVSLAASSGTANLAAHPSSLFLAGASPDKPGRLTALAARVSATIKDLKSALVGGGIDDFAARLTPEGARRVKEWFATADQAERGRYQAAITEQQPFFLFDATPLVVVYTKSPVGVRVLYFTFNAGNQLLWTNSSYITVSDRVFNKGPLRDAAVLAEPFSSIAIK